MKYKIFFLTFLFTGLYLSSFAQKDSTFLEKASRSLLGYFNINPVEKVYLHLDRPYYYPGDTIWFKAYTVIGQLHQLSAQSGVLYVELINGNDSVVNRHVLNLKAGIAWDDFGIARSYKPGNYHIRAYTNWMRNAGTEYFFNQAIRVIGPQSALVSKALPATSNKPDVQFFPEGGELVNGLRSRVALKSINAAGLGEDIEGLITDNDGNEVAGFTTQHLGMGVFAFIPQAGKAYKAKIIGKDSSKFTVDLPAARDEGFTLTINNSNADSVYIKVAANANLFQKIQNSAFYLVAQSGGRVYYATQSKLSAPVFTARVDKDRFPSGIAQFTLFSQSGEPLNERIIFIQHNDGINLKLSSPAETYQARQKVKIDIDTKNDTAHAITGSFSVAVINESRVPGNEDAESTILNDLLLTSDLKGYIEQPNYYFTDIGDQKRTDLDVLMLTQGYRRFEWKQVLSDAPQKIAFKPETDLELEGTLKTPSGTLLPKGKVTLVATRDNFITDTLTDVNGIFRFTGLNLSDTAKIVLRARKEHNGSNVAIYVKQPEYPSIVKDNKNNSTTHGTLTPEMLKNIAEYREQQKKDSLKNGRQLQEVKITAKKEPQPDQYNNYGTAIEYDVDMKKLNKEYVTIKEAIKFMVPGITYNGTFMYERRIVQLVVDGLTRKQDEVDTYSPNEIDNIRMVSPTILNPPKLIITSKRYAGTDTTSSVQLKTVTINAKRSEKPDLSHSSNLHGGGNADQVIMGDKLGDCINVSDCLTGKVQGVTFGADGTPRSTRNGSLTSASTMSVIIDGIILSGSSLNDVNKGDIYSIEVLRSGAAKAIYGTSIQPGGALVITTRREADPTYVTSTTPAGLITYPFKGYHKGKVFYSPKYDHPKTDAEPFDSRTTIYWNPNIITGKDGKASFEYYNADTKGTYRVVVEGIDEDGRLGRAVYRYKVE